MSDRIPSGVSIRTLSRGDRLFQPILELSIALSSFLHAAAANLGKENGPGQSIRLNSEKLGRAFILPAGQPFADKLKGVDPDHIQIGELAIENTAFKLVNAEGERDFGITITNLIVSPFLSYFEPYNAWLSANLGSSANWPGALNFARIVKNAASHGAITIRNPASPPVSWRIFSYDQSDNGKAIIGTDLELSEILALMLETSDDLDAVGAPIL